MPVPDLGALREGSPDAWDDAFAWLWPTAYAAADARLRHTFPAEVEEVAIESLEELVAKVSEVKAIEELPILARTIANRRAISKWRELAAQKRGSGRVESLDAPLPDGNPAPEPAGPTCRLASLELKDLQELLEGLQTDLKPEYRDVLHDLFVEGLAYEDIHCKRGWPIGTIGVYAQRALKTLRDRAQKNPGFLKEAAAYLRLLIML